MLRAIVLGLVLALPVPAYALSCMPWSMENSFQVAKDSPNPYVIVHGLLKFPKSALPKVDWNRQQDVPPETRIDARIIGHGLGSGGFEAPFVGQVEIVLRCAGPWCPGMVPDAPYLAFLKRTDTGYELEVDACSTMGFANPERALLERVQACFNGATCEPRASH